MGRPATDYAPHPQAPTESARQLVSTNPPVKLKQILLAVAPLIFSLQARQRNQISMDTSAPSLSVVIPNYQHWERAQTLLTALNTQTLHKAEWECFIVDNGSDTVPSQQELPEFVTLLECKTPGSYAARNMALPLAKGELIVFTDADCQPDPDWLEQLLAIYRKQSSPALIAGGVTVKKFQDHKPNAIEVYDMAMGLPQDRYTAKGFAVTANLAIPRPVFDSIGPFDQERYSGGDTEICLRAKKAGFPLLYAPRANVNHPARNSWNEIFTKMKRVKGGQLLAGTAREKRRFVIKTLSPPIKNIWYALHTTKVTNRQKWTTLWVIVALWLVDITLTARILYTGEKQRY